MAPLSQGLPLRRLPFIPHVAGINHRVGHSAARRAVSSSRTPPPRLYFSEVISFLVPDLRSAFGTPKLHLSGRFGEPV